MKVKIGKYKNFFGLWSLISILQLPEKYEDKLYSLLEDSWVDSLLQWIDSKRHRKISVKIDNYDIWAMDSTLAYIIVPMLEKLRADDTGAPSVDFDDVPEYLTPAYTTNMYQQDDKFQTRWKWVLDEMLFAFNTKTDDGYDDEFYNFETEEVDYVGLTKQVARIQNGFRLFGKYYSTLWT